MPKRDRAAYMRGYRKKKLDHIMLTTGAHAIGVGLNEAARKRIAELEAEVRHLKAELAKRPVVSDLRSFNSRPFTPVPKHR